MKGVQAWLRQHWPWLLGAGALVLILVWFLGSRGSTGAGVISYPGSSTPPADLGGGGGATGGGSTSDSSGQASAGSGGSGSSSSSSGSPAQQLFDLVTRHRGSTGNPAIDAYDADPANQLPIYQLVNGILSKAGSIGYSQRLQGLSGQVYTAAPGAPGTEQGLNFQAFLDPTTGDTLYVNVADTFTTKVRASLGALSRRLRGAAQVLRVSNPPAAAAASFDAQQAVRESNLVGNEARGAAPRLRLLGGTRR